MSQRLDLFEFLLPLFELIPRFKLQERNPFPRGAREYSGLRASRATMPLAKKFPAVS
jgi:hypothetical protein